MKINPDHLAALKPDAERDVHKIGKAGESFDELLSRAAKKAASVPREQASKTSDRLSGSGPAMHPHATQMLFPLATPPESETKAMDAIDNLLSQWENYAHQLASAPQGLRGAHDLLSRISTEIGELKENWPQSGGAASETGLRSMLDELEVLAVTERIKFDRGDYI
ncbi:MAG TPA: hypothetical protein ENN39_00380 [Desulfonatronum sp.]|nr:hypothetical protein [Desulfonatronum sp.]